MHILEFRMKWKMDLQVWFKGGFSKYLKEYNKHGVCALRKRAKGKRSVHFKDNSLTSISTYKKAKYFGREILKMN